MGSPRSITPKHEERRHPAGASTQREGGSASGTEVALALPGGWERWQKIHLREHEVNVDPLPVGFGRAKHHHAHGAHTFWTHAGLGGENASKFRGSGMRQPQPNGRRLPRDRNWDPRSPGAWQREQTLSQTEWLLPDSPEGLLLQTCRAAPGNTSPPGCLPRAFPSPGSLEPC